MLGNSHFSGWESFLQGLRKSSKKVCEAIGVDDESNIFFANACDKSEDCQDFLIRDSLLNGDGQRCVFDDVNLCLHQDAKEHVDALEADNTKSSGLPPG